MPKRLIQLLLLTAPLAGCIDTDALGKLPPSVTLATAVIVPTASGLLAFPVEDNGQGLRLSAPAGFLGDPGTIGDIAQRPDGNLFCTSLKLTVAVPEGFVLTPKGDVLQTPPPENRFVNLDDSPTLLFPMAVEALSDNSAILSDFDLGHSVERFSADGKSLGNFTDAISFTKPIGLAQLNGDVIVIDPAQEPRLFRFAADGTFKGAFTSDPTVVAPFAAVGSSDGSKLFVTDSTLAAVFAFDNTGQIDPNFVATEGLALPTDVAILPDGSILVADVGNADVNIAPGLRLYGSTGNLLQQLTITDLQNTDALRIAVLSNVEVHPVQ